MIKNSKKFKFTYNLVLFIIWIILFTTIAFLNPSFLSANYIVNVMLRNIVEIALVALPMTLIIISGGIDLSVGNTMVLAATLGGMAAASFGDIGAIVVTLVTGLVCGYFNGVLIAKIKISPMVTTLATMYLYLGLARGISKGDSIYSYGFSEVMGNISIIGIPMQILLYILLAVIFVLILSRTKLGRQIYSMGLNSDASKYAGIDTKKITITLYTISGLMCALIAFIWLGRFTSIKYDAGTGFHMKVITIVVLGGTSINGGIGDMRGTILGTLIIATLNSGLTVLNIPIDVQTIVQGTVLIIALIYNYIVTERIKNKTTIKIEA